LETVLVLRQVITKARFSTIEELIELIKSVGRKLVEAQPKGNQTTSGCTSPLTTNVL
jgi:translation initiation factor eIF-2B subunit beta